MQTAKPSEILWLARKPTFLKYFIQYWFCVECLCLAGSVLTGSVLTVYMLTGSVSIDSVLCGLDQPVRKFHADDS